jgi:type I restriction enzyme S subunit
MSSEWGTVQLSEVASEVTVGFVGTMANEYIDAGIPFLRSLNVDKFKINTADIKYISPDFHSRIRKSCLRPGDVVIVRTGKPGTCAVIPDDLPESNCSDLVIVRCGSEILNRFLCYYINSAASNHIAAHLVGAVQQHFNVASAKAMEIPLPSIGEQQAISNILGTLDDKIELNRKTNETLEAMAKALFKSWFVDFDPVRAKAEGRPTGLPADISDLFPDSFEDSELGEIPSGWQCCPFTQLVGVISGGTPKTSIDAYWNGSIPWFSVVDAPSGSDCWVIHTEKSITHIGLNNCSSKLLPTGTTIISARGTVGKVCLTGQDMAMNQSCYGLRSKAENGEYFCFYLTKSLVEILEARAHGSVFSTITRDTLDGVSTISPSLEIIQAFNGITGALLGKIKNNLEGNQTLANQRDTLLPKLISGELRIPDAEKLLEEAGL